MAANSDKRVQSRLPHLSGGSRRLAGDFHISQVGVGCELAINTRSPLNTFHSRSIRCARIILHMNLFASFSFNNALWLIWYGILEAIASSNDITAIADNPVSSVDALFFTHPNTHFPKQYIFVRTHCFCAPHDLFMKEAMRKPDTNDCTIDVIWMELPERDTFCNFARNLFFFT